MANSLEIIPKITTASKDQFRFHNSVYSWRSRVCFGVCVWAQPSWRSHISVISPVRCKDGFLHLKAHIGRHSSYAKCQFMTTREAYLSFSRIFLTSLLPILICKQDHLKDKKKCQNFNIFFFRIVHCYLKMWLLMYTLELSDDKTWGKIKIKIKNKIKRDEKKIIILTFPGKLNVLFAQTLKTGFITECQEVTQ